MPIFKVSGRKLINVREIPFPLEKDLQQITEENLESIFNLQFVRPKFSLNNLELDTLAFDRETKSFVIIEFKKDKNFSVIDQGFAYLSLMLNNKAEFVLEYTEKIGKTLKKDDIDWTQSKVIFVSPSFTKYQQKAINFKDLPIELWEVTRYENDTILFNQLKSPESAESIKTISKGSELIEKVSREVKVYTEEDHLRNVSEKTIELYNRLKEGLLNLGDAMHIDPQKFYIAFKAQTNFVDLEPQKETIKSHINMKKGTLDDPKKIARDVSGIGHYGNGDYEIRISNLDEIPYFITLAKQSYDKNSQ